MTRRLLRILALAIVGAVLSLGGGFLWFVDDAGTVRPIPADADGIVVLTGGALRVETGLALLRAGVARHLLISGVGSGVTTDALIGSAGVPPADPARAMGPLRRPVLDLEPAVGDITLGRGAETTVGNAVETASWARERGFRSLVVVTAGYHMRRALAEIGAAVPEVALRPFPVHPRAPLRLLGVEYLKLLAVELGMTGTPTGSLADT